ncbi:outer membrane protein [Legionella maioricensis]|uniref:Outer membrane beta-barrel protein n=1 Tax=Legionella maioricensis TaxID=2896528 RepID=A0A9X2IAW2_9GAMM|nr:outer membrane beta-barrel protein [Legionella maioricensis]MCL9684364.1 outer membrane beta-barrel protein [Legionella maioricensis]MCL9687545.1 outer membrane beta-barrel protein [Legionella maioricensis]
MSRKNYIACAVLLLVSESVLAKHLLKESTDLIFRPFGVFNVGADFIRSGRSQTVTLLPPFSNHYTNSDNYQSSGSLGGGLGIESFKSERLFWQLGVSAYFDSQVTNSGDVWQFGLPEFNNLTYSYQTQYSRIVASGKILSTVKQRIHPYLSGELGVGFNRVSGYHEIPLIPEVLPMSPFRSATQSSFTWGAGVGLDVDLNAPVRLGIGYQFADLGKASLGLSPAQLTNDTLHVSNSYTHQVRIQLTALI